MTELDNKTVAELERERIQAEIGKLKAERFEIEKRVRRRWYDVWTRTIALLVATALIVAWAISVLVPLAEINIRLAAAQKEEALVERAKAESLLTEAKDRESLAKEQEALLLERIKKMTTQQDSVIRVTTAELESVRSALESERAESQTDQKRIDELTSQKETLENSLKRAETEKKQMSEVPDLSILSGRVITRADKTTFPLEGVLVTIPDGSVKDTSDVYGNFKLRVPANSGSIVKLIFTKSGYKESAMSSSPPNFSIEQVLEKGE
jgi:DNA repair exonuclease SbcCD ATPase subunit